MNNMLLKNNRKFMLLIGVLAAATTLLMGGCSKSDGTVETMSGDASEQSVVANEESSGASEQLDNEAIGREAAFGLGKLESVPEAFVQVVENNKEALKVYQEQTAKEAGVVTSSSKTVFGHTIYAEPSRPSNVYIFSGTELIEAAVNVDLNSSDCPLYHADKLYEVLGKAEGSLKTEDGALIQEESAGWTKAADSTVQIEKVLINGEEIDTLAVGETWGTSEALRLRAFTGADNTGDLKSRSASVDTVFVVGGTQYAPIGNLGTGDLVVGFDGGESFVLLVRSMLVPTNDGFVPDMNAYTALLADTYGADFSGGFTAMQFTVDQPITVWNPQTGETEQTQALYTGDDGYLYLNVEALEAVTGMQVLLSGDGKVANIITDPQYNAMAGGADEGLSKTALNAREDVQQAANDYQVLVAMEKGRAEEERIRQEQFEKQQQEAARQQEQNLQGGQNNTAGGNSSGGTSNNNTGNNDNSTSEPGPGGTTGGSNGAGTGNGLGSIDENPREEPTSGKGKEQAERMGAVWNPDMGGWLYTDLTGNTIFIYHFGGSKVLGKAD